jgi:RHS repeat-associated protein
VGRIKDGRIRITLACLVAAGFVAVSVAAAPRSVASTNRRVPLIDHGTRVFNRARQARRGHRLAAGRAHVHTAGSMGNALILASTVTPGSAFNGTSESLEQAAAELDGFSVTVVDDAQWNAMTAAQFASYRVLILGDPTCASTIGPGSAAEQNMGTWEPVVMSSGGNKVLIGTDPIYHFSNGSAPNADVLVANGIAFAGAIGGATGVYLDLSCTYDSVPAGTPVPILDGLSSHGSGQFTAIGEGSIGACGTNVNIVATTGPTSGLTDADLSFWHCSVHEAFDSFPSDYTPLALAPSTSGFPASFCSTDVESDELACGSPYILVSGTGIVSGGPTLSEQGGAPPMTENRTTCGTGQPVNCATGVFWHTFEDVSVPGDGVPLAFTRTYTSSAAATDGPLGFGWTDNYNMSLSIDPAGDATITDENGATVTFASNGSGGFVAPSRVLATLNANPDGTYTYTRFADQVQRIFSSSGQLMKEVDRNGYVTALTYSGGDLMTATDPSGRTLTFTYSASHIATVTDPLGRTESFTYDAAGDLTSATDAAGNAWSFTYDPAHLLLSMTDPRGGETTNTYDGSNRVIKQVDSAGLATKWSYSGDPTTSTGSTTTITDPHGNVTTQTYENLQMLSATTGAGTPAAATTSYQYDPNTLGVTQVTDPHGHVSTNTYDGDGNLLSSTDALGHTTTYTYNALDEVLSKTSPLGETTTVTYDTAGNRLSSTDPLGNKTSDTYGASAHPGDVTSIADPDGRVTSLTYDSQGDVASRTVHPDAATSDTTTYSYNADGDVVCQASANANAAGVACPATGGARVPDTTTTTYNAVGEIAAIVDPRGGTTRFTYDGDGNPTSTTSPTGAISTTRYDADNRPVVVTSGATSSSPSTITTAYDLTPGSGPCFGTVTEATYCTSTTDSNGNVYVSYFDARDELIAEQRPGGALTTHTYDAAGNETSRTDPAGATATYTYDAASRVTGITYSGGATPSASYTYDADGRRTAMTDGTGTTTYSYDGDGRITSTTDGAGNAVAYTYDGAGLVTSLTYPSGNTVSRAFDGAGRMISVTDWAGRITRFGYDADGTLTATTYPNGDTVTNTLDPSDQLTGVSVGSGGLGTGGVASISYTRDASGLVTQEVDGGALSGTQDFTYNAKAQLASVNGANFQYDSAGNPTGLADGTTQAFDAADQITTATSAGSTTGYAYDPNGNRTSATPAGVAATQYGYDQANRLTAVSAPQTQVVVTGVSPNAGPLSGGTHVMISGSGFTGAKKVTFGTKAARFHVVSDTTIAAKSPPGTGTVDVVVTTPAGTSTVAPGDQFTYTKRPTISSLSPRLGPTTGGTAVTITGANFSGTTAVLFGKRSAGFTLVSDQEIQATSPPGHGVVNVRVTTPAGASPSSHTDHFSYIAGPGVVAVAPNHGPRKGGTLVLIQGFGFTGATAVHFGRTRVAFRTVSDTEIKATAPKGSGTVVVRVTTRSGISPMFRPEDAFTYDRRGGAGVLSQHAGAGALTPTTTYAYNGDNLRMSKTDSSGTTTQFSWDSISSRHPDVLSAGSSEFVYGPDGLPIEQVTSASVEFFVHDGVGSTRLLLATDGSVAATFTFDAYGGLTSETGAARTPLLYAGAYLDVDTGFYYLINRYYDPATAQFLSVDAALDLTLTPYSYAGDNPVNAIDPLGLDWWQPWTWSSQDWSTAATVGGIAIAAVGVGVLTGGLGDLAFLGGADAVLGGVDVALNVDAGVGAIADTVTFANDGCFDLNNLGTAQCEVDAGGLVLDGTTFGLGQVIPKQTIKNYLASIGGGITGLVYSQVTQSWVAPKYSPNGVRC